MKNWGYLIVSLLLWQYAPAQNTAQLQVEMDEYSRYISPDLTNGLVLLEANQSEFQNLMKQYQYQLLPRGDEQDYLSPTNRVNQMRLIRKGIDNVYFMFSPTKLDLIKHLEQSINELHPIVTKDKQGMTWYSFLYAFKDHSKKYRIGIKMDADTEDRVGRTWKIWSTTVVFSNEM